jgi:MFS family permease
VFKSPGATALLGAMMATGAVNLFFYANLLLQYRFGLTATQTAVLLVVPQTAGVAGGLIGGWASARVGSLMVTAVACAIGSATSLAFLTMNDSSTAMALVLPFSLFSVAAGCITGSLTKAFLDCADPAASGAASSWRQIGWSLGATFGGVVTSAIALGYFTSTWSNTLRAAGVNADTAQRVADAVRAGVPLNNLATSPALNSAINREAIDALVGLSSAQVETFRVVGALSAIAYGVALALVVFALWRQRQSLSISQPVRSIA